MFRIIQRRYWFFAFSLIILIPGFIAFALYGVPRSIDFTGGAFYDVAFEDPEPVTEQGIREVYSAHGIGGVQVVEAAQGTRHQIRSESLDPETKEAVRAGLVERFGELEENLFDQQGPSVGALVTRNASIAVIMASVGILIYLTLQFRTVPHPIRYGVCTIVAMLHDVGLVVGLAAIMGKFYGWEIDALFITALLTIIGFSVHDSIVVFDRVRENLGRMRGYAYEDVVNHSVIQTLDRSINTQLTAIFTLIAIFVFSQGQIQRFMFWLIVGVASGTYSSIFNAAPLLVVWHNREWRHWFGRGEPAVA